MLRLVHRWGFAIVLTVFAPPSLLRAQDVTEEDKSEARELFSKGVAASESGNPEAAVDYFEQSFSKFPAPNTAVNIAGIYLELENYDAVIEWANRAKALPDIQPSAAEIADSYIAQASPYAKNVSPQAQADPEPEPEPASEPEPSEVDKALVEEPAEHDADGGAITDQWWFWAGVGVVVVGATVGIVAAASGGEEDPIGGNLMPGVVTWN